MHDAVLIQKEKLLHPANRFKAIYFLDIPLYDIYQRAEFHSKFFNNIIPYIEDIDIYNPKINLLERFLEKEPIIKELHTIQNSFKNVTILQFYTDSSVVDIEKELMSMSLAFYQNHFFALITRFKATIKCFLLSTRCHIWFSTLLVKSDSFPLFT